MDTVTDQSTNFKIRRAQLADAEAIAFININSWKETYVGVIDQQFLESLQASSRVPAVLQRIERKDLDCLVAIDHASGNIVGFADFGPSRDKKVEADSELYAIYLRQSFHRKGIGQSLFACGYNLVKNRGYEKMFVSVFEKNNKARAFYEKMDGRILSHSQLELAGKWYQTANYYWMLK